MTLYLHNSRYITILILLLNTIVFTNLNSQRNSLSIHGINDGIIAIEHANEDILQIHLRATGLTTFQE